MDSEMMSINTDNINNGITENELTTTKINIYRYKFTQDIMDMVTEFAKVHQYDDRKIFKEAWTNWLELNDSSVTEEVTRLKGLGYEGDIIDKMFKSARYYFRKKSTVKQDPKERKTYVCVHKEMNESIDTHIVRNMVNDDYKPSTGFQNFCANNTDILKVEISRLMAQNMKDSGQIQEKIKKTYKNRYFILVSK